MSKKIYPGNWVNSLSSYQGASVVAIPGARYHQVIGRVLVSATGGVAFDVVIPSPDLRQSNKPRADITGMVIPSGAYLYRLGLRVPDVRKDLAYGTPRSGLVGTNGDRIKLASAATIVPGTLNSATTASSAALTIASTTIAPSAGASLVVAPQLLSSPVTLRVFVDNGANAASSNALTSSATGGTYLICEACYITVDDVPVNPPVPNPYIVESV